MGAAVPKEPGEADVKNAIKTVAGNSVIVSEITRLRNELGDYHFYGYDVSNLNTGTETANLNSITSANGAGETTSRLILTFDKDIEGLSINNITVDNAQKTGFRKLENQTGTYELSIKDIVDLKSSQISVKVGIRIKYWNLPQKRFLNLR